VDLEDLTVVESRGPKAFDRRPDARGECVVLQQPREPREVVLDAVRTAVPMTDEDTERFEKPLGDGVAGGRSGISFSPEAARPASSRDVGRV
jgi:hypothetical protein